MKICIVYIAIGEYEKFWDIFYPSCQTFFCVDAEKKYELFTDSERLFNINYPNVNINQVSDKGFIVNVSSKSKFMLTIEKRLKEYDYIFYLNGNFRFLSPIHTQEIIPPPDKLAFTVLSFDEYSGKSPRELPYDRNSSSGAFIPNKLGKRYYQGGFFGGSYEEIMKYNNWAAPKIENDLGKGIIARFHDESYLNKYLIDKEPYIVNNKYAYYPGTNYKGKIKAELIDKASFFGKEKLYEIRDKYFQSDYSCLMTNDGETSKLGIVRAVGGLGNQLFILAFYYYMRDVLKMKRQLLIDYFLYENYNFHSGFELQRLFEIKDDIFLSNKLKKKLSTIPIEVIYEEDNSVFQEIRESKSEVTYFSGYWQCAKYVNSNDTNLRKIIKFDESKLTPLALDYLTKIKESKSSVSIHVRRGDYLDKGNTLIYYDLCSSNYYQKAIAYIETFDKAKHTYFIFSDDLDWVKINFQLDNMVIVDLGKNDSPWQDMYLMSKCNHNIISNSTFAWWGAWLNTSINRTVLAPSHWYNGINTPDLFPEDWIVIKMEDKFSFQEKISTYLLLKDNPIVCPGLLNGKMGLCIYLFQTGRITKKSKYEIFATSLLEEIYDDISKRWDFGFGNYGILGIAIGIQFLAQEGYIEGDPNEILSEIDSNVKKIFVENNSLSFPRMCDLLKYIILRTQNSIFVRNLSEDQNFNKAVSTLLNSFQRNIICNEANNNDALNILNELRKMEIFQYEVEDIIFRLIKEKFMRDNYTKLHIKNLLDFDLSC